MGNIITNMNRFDLIKAQDNQEELLEKSGEKMDEEIMGRLHRVKLEMIFMNIFD